MIFSSAHTDTQDRTVSTTTSITPLCPSWHNIIDIQGGGTSLFNRDQAFNAPLLLLLLLQEKRKEEEEEEEEEEKKSSLDHQCPHPGRLEFTFKLGAAQTQELDPHVIDEPRGEAACASPRKGSETFLPLRAAAGDGCATWSKVVAHATGKRDRSILLTQRAPAASPPGATGSHPTRLHFSPPCVTLVSITALIPTCSGATSTDDGNKRSPAA
ncbi:unnamed protein product [Pleuronectes platessa]|uniref:Uncharacterized protein n=1 Tax=Pleuronectes platessa TaxID=8262 RepID=A0A9N7VMI7_PLEPL|nr:unnamed protein product [Pleuronectes platessa]